MSFVRNLVFIHAEESIKAYALLSDSISLKDSADRNGFFERLELSIQPPYLIILVEPHQNKQTVKSSHAIYHSGEIRKEIFLTTPLQNMSLFFNESCVGAGTLVEKVDRYCGFFAEIDLEPLMLTTFREDSGMMISPEESNLSQRICDSFIIDAASYLTTLQLLLDPEILETFPFSFTLPYISVNEEVWSTNMFRYLSYPALAVVQRFDSHNIKILCGHIVDFNNKWGPLFEDGSDLDCSSAMMDTMSGYMTMISESMSNLSAHEAKVQTNFHNFYAQIQGEITEKLCKEAEYSQGLIKSIFMEHKAEFDRLIEENASQAIEKFKERFETIIKSDLQTQLMTLSKQLESTYEERFRNLEKSVSTLFETQRKFFEQQRTCPEQKTSSKSHCKRKQKSKKH